VLFSKIKYSENSGVELQTKIQLEGGAGEARTFTCSEPPLPELPAALQAFKAFVLSLVPLMDDYKRDESGEIVGHVLDDLTVTTLHVDEESKTKRLGIIVTAVLPIDQASGRPLVINTPRMREWEDDGNDQPKGTFGEDITQLIDAAQDAARAYYGGQRGQTEIFTAAETTTAAPEKTNGTDPAKAPKVRRQRRVKEITEAGRVFNPEATQPPTDEQLRGQLAVSGVDVPSDVIATWTSSQRDGAMAWACAPDGVPMPTWVKDGAALDAWRDTGPVRLTPDAQQEIAAALEAGD
jgi:hypothetical protein